jgi:WD repeat-containing protein mio
VAFVSEQCFAWSPDSVLDDLIAVGLSTGRVDLMRLEAAGYARDNVLSNGPCVSLPVRSSRSCNALAFCPLDPNYLAVGLDKVRGDSSLVLWDISTAIPTLSFTESPDSATLLESPAVKTNRSQALFPRAEFGSKADTRMVQQHAPTEIVSSLSFSTQSNCLLWAGISNRWLRLFDLRTAVPSTTNVANKVQGIATDPYEPHHIGTFCDGIVSIWDSRRLLHPLVTITEKEASEDGFKPSLNSTYVSLEFSSVRRGVLATLERDAVYVRFWDLQEAQPIELISRERSRDSSRSGAGRLGGGRLSWANPTSMLSWTSSTGSNLSSGDAREPVVSAPTSNIVLSDTRKSTSLFMASYSND